MWTWTAGDGWHGPDITNEFWVDLNAWVISRFAQQPWRTEPELFAEHAREVLKLGDTQARLLRDEYERLWRERRQLKQDHPSCPTRYIESQHGAWGAPPAMDATVRAYRDAVRKQAESAPR